MISAYLIVVGVLAMAAGYITLMHYLISRVERRDLAALAGTRLKPAPRRPETISMEHPDALPVRA